MTSRSGVLSGPSKLEYQQIWPARLKGRSFLAPALKHSTNGPIFRNS